MSWAAPAPVYQTQIVARGPRPLGQGSCLLRETSYPVPFAFCYSWETETLL